MARWRSRSVLCKACTSPRSSRVNTTLTERWQTDSPRLHVCAQTYLLYSYGLRCCNAFRKGALEILMKPSKGWFSSRTRKIAAETAQAPKNRTVREVTLDGANKPKLTNRRASQKTRMKRSGSGSWFCSCSINSQRVCPNHALCHWRVRPLRHCGGSLRAVGLTRAPAP